MNRRRTDTTRRDIMKTARALFQKQGYDETSLQDIANLLDLSEAVVIACFSSMDDLLEAIWSE